MLKKIEKEMLFDAEKGIYDLRELIRKRGRELNSGEFASLTSGFLNGLVFALNTFDIEMSEDFEEEALALMDRIID
jgi:hypothetical protein